MSTKKYCHQYDWDEKIGDSWQHTLDFKPFAFILMSGSRQIGGDYGNPADTLMPALQDFTDILQYHGTSDHNDP